MLKYNFKLNNVSGSTIDIPFGDIFSPKTQQYDFIENRFDLTTSDIINPTVDMEKVKLSPYYTTDYENFTKVKSISIEPHFYSTQLNDWDSGITKISDIGFAEDDVKNRRSCVQNTFIRCSFYTSTDPETQLLLGYNTIYLDSYDLYTDYISSGSNFNSLTSEFTLEEPNLSKKVKSLEGFNVYYFKSDLLKNQIQTIYMKVEFNNAKNGKRILFSRVKETSTIESLYQNIYFQINCQYEPNIDGYIYSYDTTMGLTLSNLTSDNKLIDNVLTIPIYQAKVL